MSNTQNAISAIPISVQTNVRKSTTDDLPVAEDLLYCHSAFDGERTSHNGEPFILTPKEEQTVHYAALTSRFRVILDTPQLHSRPSRNSLIVSADSFSDEENDLDDSHEDLIVTLYEGSDETPFNLGSFNWNRVVCSAEMIANNGSDPSNACDDDEIKYLKASSTDFQRSWSSVNQDDKSRYRWLKIQHVHNASAKTDWSELLAVAHARLKVDDVRMCHLTVKISRRVLTTQQLAQCGNNAVRDCEISRSTGIPVDSVKKLAGLEMADKPSLLRQLQPHDSFMGADLISGVQWGLRTDNDDSLYIVEKTRTKLFYSHKPYTLADVVSQRHHHQLELLQSREGIAMLNKEFERVQVNVRVGKHTETRVIAGFREGKAFDAPLTLRHYAWSLKGEAIVLPNLPCVNVGTQTEPLLLPLELCTVLPHQRLRGAIDAPLSRMFDHSRLNAVSRPQTNHFESTWGRVVAPSFSLKGSGPRHEKVARAFGQVFPNLLFVEAGSEKLESANWRLLEESVRAQIKESLEWYAAKYAVNLYPIHIPTNQSPRLRLQYDSDDGLGDRWTEQLRTFVTNNIGYLGQQTFVIVYLPADTRHSKMYNIIKKACDITAGSQTYFVNHANLEAKVCQSPLTGLSQVAAELRRKMCLRNLPMMIDGAPMENLRVPKHLVIAMHISPVGFPSRLRIASRHASKSYLVALVSSDLNTGGHYHTQVELYNSAEVESLNMAALFEPFIHYLSTRSNEVRHDVTILRSGYFPKNQAGTGNAATVPLVRAWTAKAEMAMIRKAFGQTVSPRGLTYITLKEDKVLNLSVITTGLALPALVLVKDNQILDKADGSFRVTHVHGAGAKTGVIAVDVLRSFSLATVPTADADTLAQLRSHSPASTAKQRPSHRFGYTGSPTTPLRLGDHVDRRPGSSKSTGASPSPFATPIKPIRFSQTAIGSGARAPSGAHVPLPSRPDDLEDDGSAAAEFEHMTLDPEPAVNIADAEMLTKLWDGHELELSGTKWPVATHLAHLAVKRALLHLDSKDWHANTKNTTAPLSLPPVHKDVRNSLYYL